MDHLSIAKKFLKNVSTGETVPVESLWENNACVFAFFRRFGCVYCRVAAKDLSKMKALLDEHHVRLIGVGTDETGVEDFVKGEFFNGELFVDIDKQCFNALGFKRFNYFNIFTSMFSSEGRAGISSAREEKVGGDLKGDRLQNGGTLVVSTGGEKCLLLHKAQNVAEYTRPNEILEILGIKERVKEDDKESEAHQCTEDDVCQLNSSNSETVQD